MNLSDFQKLCERLNSYCRHALEAAVYLARERTHFDVTIDHYLCRLLDDPNCDAALIARAYDVDLGQWVAAIQQSVDGMKTGNSGGVHWTEDLIGLVERAWMISSTHFNYDHIRTGTLLVALLALRGESATFHASMIGGEGHGKALDAIAQRDLATDLPGLIEGSCEGKPGEAAGPSPAARPGGSALEKFTVNLNDLAREGQLDRAIGRDSEIRQVVDILCRRRKNNAILVGEPGVGKTAIAEGLARRIVEKDVPDVLADSEILSLDLGRLQAGAGVKGEFENRLKQIIEEVAASSKPIVLFIDEAHLLIGAGGQPGGSDAANLLKPALARGRLRSIAACTWAEYKKHFEKDAALQDRFELVKIEEPSEELAVTMLRGTKDAYEEHHKVQILDEGVEAAVRLSGRYLTGRQLPRKAVDLLDTACARVRVGITSKPAEVDDLQRRLDNLNIERVAKLRDQDIGAADHGPRLAELDELITQTQVDLDHYQLRWQTEKEAAAKYLALRDKTQSDDGAAPDQDGKLLREAIAELRELQGDHPLVPIHVDQKVTAKVIADWTGIPVGSMVEDELPKLAELEARLRGRVCGQDHALGTLAETIRINKAGLGDPGAPIGVFLLVGPSGIGKTETALALADVLFGGERFMATINMSEFKEEHTISLLIGSPPGYVGYGEGGVLTEAVRQRPYTVVLLDEVEKAHPQIMELFYQIFDKGYCEDRTGRYISFRNTIILMTSNLDSQRITEMCATVPRPDPDEIVEAIRPTLSDHFKPALLARFRVIPYLPLDASVLREVVTLKLDKLAKRFRDVHNIEMEYAEGLRDDLADRCQVTELGARQLDHLISEDILPKLSMEMLACMAQKKIPERVRLDVAESGVYSFAFT